MMSHKQSTASFVKHTVCPHCGSSDANSLYSDGHSFCFACQTGASNHQVRTIEAKLKEKNT